MFLGVWVFFGAVLGWAFGCQRACVVCSRLLEMADVRRAVYGAAYRQRQTLSASEQASPLFAPDTRLAVQNLLL